MDDTTTDLGEGHDGGRPWVVALVVVIATAVVALVVALAVSRSDDDDDATPSSTTPPVTQPASSTSAPTTTPETTTPPTTTPETTTPPTTTPETTTPPTTAPETTTPPTTTPEPTTPETTVPPPVDQLRNAIFPTPGTATTYSEPEAAAREFALAVGYADPVTGDFQAGDSRSGEVEVRAAPSTLTTIVFVRQLDDSENWYVIGAASENIEVDTPDALDVITSPLDVAGRARAFEGTVGVLLTADDIDEPVLETFVTGSGGPEPGPFEDSFEFESPDAEGGALLFLSRSSEDGSVLEMSALRVFFEDE